MKVLVVYDSVYGNTERIAKTIGEAVAGDVQVARVGEISATGLQPVDVMIVGSPTLGGRPTEPIQNFLAAVPPEAIKGIRVASFDTRYSGKFVKLFGFAAERIMQTLEAKGGRSVPPLGEFVVTGKKGPLKDGELERAASWAREIVK